MALKPVNWSVVIVGRWNPAILTPAGMARHVFGIEAGSERPVEVRVPIDGLSPHIVKHPEEPLTARLDERRLRIEAQHPDYRTLAEAMKAGLRALQTLPVTPFTAAGINVYFEVHEDIERLIEIVSAEIDGPLSDLGYMIEMRGLARRLEWKGGVINLTIASAEKGFQVQFNFHRESRRQSELVGWLQEDVGNVRSCVESILEELGLEIEETANGRGDD